MLPTHCLLHLYKVVIVPGQIYIVPGQIYDLMSDKYTAEPIA